MTNGKDKVKLRIHTRDVNRYIELITSRTDAESFLESFIDAVSLMLEIKGQINDADANAITFIVRSESVGAVEISEINSEF